MNIPDGMNILAGTLCDLGSTLNRFVGAVAAGLALPFRTSTYCDLAPEEKLKELWVKMESYVGKLNFIFYSRHPSTANCTITEGLIAMLLVSQMTISI